MKNILLTIFLISSTSLYAGGAAMNTSSNSMDSRYYMSLGMSFDDLDGDINSVTNATLDEDDEGISIKFGMDYSDLLSFEFGYRQYGNLTISDNGAGTGVWTTDGNPTTDKTLTAGGRIVLDAYAYTFMPKFKYNYSSNVDIYAGIGLMYFRTRSDIHATFGAAGVSTDTVRDFEPYYEVGAEYKLNNTYSATLSYENVDDIDATRIESIVASIKYRF
jgi:opacity protein-like surface antigen